MLFPQFNAPKQYVNPQFLHIEEIESTNDFIMEKYKLGEMKSGDVVLADFQSEGRGQRGKVWQVQPGDGLLASIVADLNDWKIKNIISLNHIISLSIQKFLQLIVKDVKIKWPNDIMVDNQKICGILIENKLSSTHRTSVIGIGINLNQEDFEVARATSLHLETGSFYKNTDLLPHLIATINEFINLYHEKGEEYIFNLYNQELWKLRERFIFNHDMFRHEGAIQSTTMNGELVVAFVSETQKFANGTVYY